MGKHLVSDHTTTTLTQSLLILEDSCCSTGKNLLAGVIMTDRQDNILYDKAYIFNFNIKFYTIPSFNANLYKKNFFKVVYLRYNLSYFSFGHGSVFLRTLHV